MGGRGASMKESPRFKSDLEAFRENSRQFNQAKERAKQSGASVLVYTHITGKTSRWYWNGAAYVDRKAALHVDKYRQGGVYKASFK